MPVYEPQALGQLVEERAAALSHAELFLRPQHGRLREMWCASRFGLGFGDWVTPCQIEIEENDEQQQHDFHVLTKAARYPFQLVEAMDEGRKRGDEYKNNSKAELEQIFRERPLQNAEYAGKRAAEELQKKLKKYGPSPDLHILVYLNLNAAAVNWAILRNSAEALSKNFASVWAITGDMICCIWGGNHWAGLVTWRRIE